jgi:nucleoside-diphosphate-sugar epimerase
MSKQILVTGAGGFIGSAVCKKLTDKYSVIAVVSPFSESSRLKDIKTNLTIVKVNLSDSNKVKELFKKYKPDVVLHLATHGVYQYQQQDEERILIENYLMAVNLLKYSVDFGVKKFVNTGSVFEYGSKPGKVKESNVDITDILNKYSAVKMATTALANSYSDKLQVITLRPFTTYGPGEDQTRFIKATIERALKNEPISIAGKVVRDFVFVEDVASAFSKAIEINYRSGEIVNIASGKKETLEHVAKLIKKMIHSKSKIVVDTKYKRQKESACWADISKAKRILKWSPQYNMNQGLTKTVDFIKK